MVQATCESWRLAIEYEKRLKADSRKKSFWDPSIRALRKSVREAYEAALFEDYAFSQANDVEQALWKICYYRPIEEFRNRLKLAAGAASGTAPLAGVTVDAAAREVEKTSEKYRDFLADSAVNYKSLAARLQAVYGDLGVDLQLDPGAVAQVAAHVAAFAARTPEGARIACHASVHRCLVYLGDLSRYKAQVRYPDPAQQARERAEAVCFYHKAAQVLPSSGNPFNQLAVMAYLNQQELLSVYYYFRALGVSSPFTTARENLLLLFESNRTRYNQLQSAASGGSGGGGGTANPLATLSVRYVRLAALLYDRINLETLPDVRAACAVALRAALVDPSLIASQAAGSAACTPNTAPLLQAASIVVFGAHALSGGAAWTASQVTPDQAPATSESARTQQPLLKRVALTALMEMAGCLCVAACSQLPAGQACGQANSTSNTGDSMDVLLAPLNVLLAWLASSSSEPLFPAPLQAGSGHSSQATTTGAAAQGPAPTKQSPLDEGGAAWAEVTVRATFWRHAARLVRHLAGILGSHAGAAGVGSSTGTVSLLDGALHHPPCDPLLPEEFDLLGYVPLAESHALLPQQPPIARSTPASASRQTSSDLHASVARSGGSTNGGPEAMQVDVHVPDASQRQAHAGPSMQRAQRVMFWLHRAAVKVAGVTGAGQAALANSVSGVALQNLEKAVKEFGTAMEDVVAKADAAAAQAASVPKADAPTAATAAAPTADTATVAAAVAPLPQSATTATVATAQTATAATVPATTITTPAAAPAVPASVIAITTAPAAAVPLFPTHLPAAPSIPLPSLGLQSSAQAPHATAPRPVQPAPFAQHPAQPHHPPPLHPKVLPAGPVPMDVEELEERLMQRPAPPQSRSTSRDHSAMMRSVSSGTLAYSRRSSGPTEHPGQAYASDMATTPSTTTAAPSPSPPPITHGPYLLHPPGRSGFPSWDNQQQGQAHTDASGAPAYAHQPTDIHGPPPEQLPLPRQMTTLSGSLHSSSHAHHTRSSGPLPSTDHSARDTQPLSAPPRTALQDDPATVRAANIAASLLRNTLTNGPPAPTTASRSAGGLSPLSVFIPQAAHSSRPHQSTSSGAPGEAPLVPQVTPSNTLLWRASFTSSSQPASPSPPAQLPATRDTAPWSGTPAAQQGTAAPAPVPAQPAVGNGTVQVPAAALAAAKAAAAKAAAAAAAAQLQTAPAGSRPAAAPAKPRPKLQMSAADNFSATTTTPSAPSHHHPPPPTHTSVSMPAPQPHSATAPPTHVPHQYTGLPYQPQQPLQQQQQHFLPHAPQPALRGQPGAPGGSYSANLTAVRALEATALSAVDNVLSHSPPLQPKPRSASTYHAHAAPASGHPIQPAYPAHTAPPRGQSLASPAPQAGTGGDFGTAGFTFLDMLHDPRAAGAQQNSRQFTTWGSAMDHSPNHGQHQNGQNIQNGTAMQGWQRHPQSGNESMSGGADEYQRWEPPSMATGSAAVPSGMYTHPPHADQLPDSLDT